MIAAAPEPRALLLGISAWGGLAIVVASALGLLWGGLPSGIGLFMGGNLALLSFWWLGAETMRLSPDRVKTWARFGLLTALRYLTIVVILMILVRASWVSLPALALGLAVPLPVIVWRGIKAASQYGEFSDRAPASPAQSYGGGSEEGHAPLRG
ncbi:MAG TPA: ATP synthase subunit I [Methylomirabilota bacterium]|nr:ATP synthase subunit I [Methylomirabilota bacterium]